MYFYRRDKLLQIEEVLILLNQQIYYGNDTQAGLACALDSCLLDNVTCIETCSNDSLNEILTELGESLDCLVKIDDNDTLFYSDVEEYLLYDADGAWVKACESSEGGDNCSVV